MSGHRIPPRLAWHADEEATDGLRVYCMALPDGQPRMLDGVAALIWASAAEGEEPVAVVTAATGQSRADVEAQVLTYLGLLVDDGLLERGEA